MTAQFGQFVAHDIAFTPSSRTSELTDLFEERLTPPNSNLPISLSLSLFSRTVQRTAK